MRLFLHRASVVMAASTASMAATRAAMFRSSTSLTAKPIFLSSQRNPWSSRSFFASPFKALKTLQTAATPDLRPLSHNPPPAASAAETSAEPASTTFHGVCYVLKDNIDTDQIIPAEHLTLVPSKPDEYRKLGSFALVGLPSAAYPVPFVEPGEFATKYPIIIGGANFGCGSSREHAPVALGASGVRAVVAESYARIFFRNSVSTGEIYPLESEGRLCDECSTGDVVTVELEESKLINHTTGKEYKLKPIGDAGPVIEAGGIFAYARKTGMIPKPAS